MAFSYNSQSQQPQSEFSDQVSLDDFNRLQTNNGNWSRPTYQNTRGLNPPNNRHAPQQQNVSSFDKIGSLFSTTIDENTSHYFQQPGFQQQSGNQLQSGFQQQSSFQQQSGFQAQREWSVPYNATVNNAAPVVDVPNPNQQTAMNLPPASSTLESPVSPVLVECEFCYARFANLSGMDYRNHLKFDHNHAKTAYTPDAKLVILICPECQVKHKDKVSLMRCKQNHKKQKSKEKEKENEWSCNKGQCASKPKQFDTKKAMLQHLNRHHQMYCRANDNDIKPQEFNCQFCAHQPSSVRTLRVHEKKCSSNPENRHVQKKKGGRKKKGVVAKQIDARPAINIEPAHDGVVGLGNGGVVGPDNDGVAGPGNDEVVVGSTNDGVHNSGTEGYSQSQISLSQTSAKSFDSSSGMAFD